MPQTLLTGLRLQSPQYYQLLHQGSQGSQDLPNQGFCQTLTRDNIVQNSESDDSCVYCEDNVFDVSDTEDHQLSTTPNPCLERYPTIKNRLFERIKFWKSIGASNWILKS